MHTVGPKSFARVRDQMMNENPNKEPPSLGEMFERTRKRTEGKSYVDSYDDLSKKIEEIQKCTPSEDEKGQTDAFLAIMGKEHNGHRRLYGRGVTNKKLRKVNNSEASYVVPGELMQSIKAGVVEDIQKDMESEVMKIQDMRTEIEADYVKKKSELEQMQTQVENQRGDMFETIMANIISKLPTDIARKYLS